MPVRSTGKEVISAAEHVHRQVAQLVAVAQLYTLPACCIKFAEELNALLIDVGLLACSLLPK